MYSYREGKGGGGRERNKALGGFTYACLVSAKISWARQSRPQTCLDVVSSVAKNRSVGSDIQE